MTNEELTAEALATRERIGRAEEQIKSLYTQNDEWKSLVASVNSLAVSVQIMAEEQKGLAEKVGVLSQDVADLKSKPGKRWDTVLTTLLTVIVTAFATFTLAKIGIR